MILLDVDTAFQAMRDRVCALEHASRLTVPLSLQGVDLACVHKASTCTEQGSTREAAARTPIRRLPQRCRSRRKSTRGSHGLTTDLFQQSSAHVPHVRAICT